MGLLLEGNLIQDLLLCWRETWHRAASPKVTVPTVLYGEAEPAVGIGGFKPCARRCVKVELMPQDIPD